MSKLNIDEKVLNIICNELTAEGHICIIGGSKCGKSKLALEIISRLSRGKNVKKMRMNKIQGVSYAEKYVIEGLSKPIVFFKNVSGMRLLELKNFFRDYYMISTFPVSSVDILGSRFQAMSSNYNKIKHFDEQVWGCIPVVINNKKLGDGNVYIMEFYETQYKDGCILKDSICRFVQDRCLFEEDFSRVTGKYVFDDESYLNN